jgi:hypothetical protein
MDKIIKYHSKYLRFIIKIKFDPIALFIVLIFLSDLKYIYITYILLLILFHLPLILYKIYKKIKSKNQDKK